jgi:protein-tyrosine-phosphatase
MTEYTTGDIDLKVKITNEKNVTIDDVVQEAASMYKIARARNLKFGDLEAADALMSEFRKSNPEFSKSYPIVLRYMCQMQEFDSRALRKYLLKIKEHPWKNEKEYLDSQADYVVILYQAKHSKWNRTQINNIRANVRATLQREHDMFTQYVKEFDREVSAQEQVLKKKSMDELTEFVREASSTISDKAGTVRMETDLTSGVNVDIDLMAAGLDSTIEYMSADNLLGN